MAGAPTPAGFAYFAGVKAVGYTAASIVLKRGYQALAPVKSSVFTVGLTRTGIGLAAGLLYGGLWIFAGNQLRLQESEKLFVYYYLFLLPVRLVEWTFLIWLFFDRVLQDRGRLWKYVAFGTICSYVLDAIGVGAALVLPGGFWVC
jgi:hypothetical protein